MFNQVYRSPLQGEKSSHEGAIADIFTGLLSLMSHYRLHPAKRLSKADLLPQAGGFIPIALW